MKLIRITTLMPLALVAFLCLTVACSKNNAPPASSAPASRTGAASSLNATATGATGPAVPAKYQKLYAHLSASLDAYQAAIDAMPASANGAAATITGAELLPANGNRLEQLLAPATMPAVDAWLDRFRQLGIKGVTLGVKLPMLLPSFSDKSDAYTTFFATVADHARARGMTVDVELGALFCGTTFANCTNPFNGSYQGFVQVTVAQAKIVISRIRPDYLTILSEPTTEGALTGVKEMVTPAGSARYVHDVLAGIGDRGQTKVGAGGASWMPPSYNEAILAESIDYLVIHIYPVSAQVASTIVTDTELAKKAGKPIVADEVGLYKTDSATPAGAAMADTVYRLDNFSLFEPLDVRFVMITQSWLKKAGAAYASFYWAGQFFGYVDWTAELDGLPYQALTQRANQEISAAFQAGKVTQLGRTWAAGAR